MSTVQVLPPVSVQPNQENLSLSVADAVWVGMALLQHAAKSEQSFETGVVVATTDMLRLTKGQRSSIYLHVNQHCVANRPPHQNRFRMLFETGKGQRRLFRDGDRYDRARAGSPTHPAWAQLPESYRFLEMWYENEWNGTAAKRANDPLLALIGVGADLWKDEHADEYVAHLRSGWSGAL